MQTIPIVSLPGITLSIHLSQVGRYKRLFGFTYYYLCGGICDPASTVIRGTLKQSIGKYLFEIAKEPELRPIKHEIHDYIKTRKLCCTPSVSTPLEE